MPQPDTIQDVLTLVRKSRVVDDIRLTVFLDLLHTTGLIPAGTAPNHPNTRDERQLTPASTLSLMVEQGLLTRYQADELAAGRWWGLCIGGYRILEPIGRGGMGRVFLAEHGLLAKQVAVKVLVRDLQADPAARDRFLREARAAGAVDHPNVVRVFDIDAEHEPPFLVMEYVDGVSLQAAVARHGAFSAGEAAAVGAQVAAGLAAAAAVGLVHRDIKPANVLVDRKGQVKVLDLGIARFTADPASCLVDTEVILGTLDYLAPEQAVDSSAVDPRADLYALGATLYFLLAGHPPYPDDDVARKLDRKLYTDPPPIDSLRPDVPPGLAVAIQRLLARDPARRYQHPRDAESALRLWADVGTSFPDRLFQPRSVAVTPRNAAASPQGAPTDPGQDHDPTPLPATRNIIRARVNRPPPTAPLDGAPTDRGGSPAANPTHTPPADPEAISLSEDSAQAATPTIRLTPVRMPDKQVEPSASNGSNAAKLSDAPTSDESDPGSSLWDLVVPEKPMIARPASRPWHQLLLWWLFAATAVAGGILTVILLRRPGTP